MACATRGAAHGASTGRETEGSAGESKPLSVSQALELVKGTLKGIRLTIVGEVSEVTAKRTYKAVYFSVKDRSSTLSCLMWNDLYRASGMQLEVGQEVEISGFFSLYAARGTMNFDVRRLSLAGEGKLRMEVARRAKKLQAEGLMDPARKRTLPEYPQVVGVVTSPAGDAVHDVLRTLRRRWPIARVLVAGVQVEGAQAADNLIAGLERIASSDAELVILGRGGGQYETMMPFNDERLARAIAACPIPVVTGIGHEPDNFIADMVADVRASTPTWAAAAAVPDVSEVREMLAGRRFAADSAIRRKLDGERASVGRLADRPVLRDARSLFAQEAMGVDHLAARLERALPAVLASQRASVDALSVRLASALPQAMVRRVGAVDQLAHRLRRLLSTAGDGERAAVKRQTERLRAAGSATVSRARQEMGLRAARLNDLSPLAVLGRGFALARDEQGGIVKTVEGLSPGDALSVAFKDGVAACRVEGVRHVRSGYEPLDA